MSFPRLSQQLHRVVNLPGRVTGRLGLESLKIGLAGLATGDWRGVIVVQPPDRRDPHPNTAPACLSTLSATD